MDFNPITFDQTALAGYSALFDACFPGTNRFTKEYLRWLYVDNPDGKAFGFDARNNGVLAAHYVCVPVSAIVNGCPARVLLSLNTATHPQFQGKGLFTKLAAMTYDAAALAGFEGVYGVANANSTPGFIRKLGFQLVRPLDALIGVGRIGAVRGTPAKPLAFERIWDAASLNWRCASPYNLVQRKRHGDVWQFYSSAVGPWLQAYGEVVLDDQIELSPTNLPLTPLKLYLGLIPDDVKGLRNYAAIPQRFRPSPLNLIYRSLATPGAKLDSSRINFSFLDFDAY